MKRIREHLRDAKHDFWDKKTWWGKILWLPIWVFVLMSMIDPVLDWLDETSNK